MDLSKFFMDRPIFAAVLSIVIFVSGLLAIPALPISEYPKVVVRAVYPGANPKVIAETVATPGGADQRRRRHDVHQVCRRLRRRAGDHGHLPFWHQRR